MRNSMLAFAVLCAATSGACGQSTVSIYGVLDLSVRYVKNNSGSIWSQQSGDQTANRLGFVGSENLGGGNSVNFRIESSITPDTGGAGGAVAPVGQFWNRASWISLRNQSLGELRLGRDYQLGFMNIAPLEPFNYGGLGSISNLLSSAQNVPINQAFGATDAASGLTANTTISSVNNTAAYYTPSNLGGFNAGVMVAAGEGAARASNTGAAKFRAVRLGYTAGPINVMATNAVTANTNIGGEKFAQNVVAGVYDFGFGKLHAIYAQFKISSARSKVWLVGTTVPVGTGSSFRIAYSTINQSGALPGTSTSIDDRDARQLALGFTHNLSKRTAVYANLARMSNKGRVAGFLLTGGPAFNPGSDRLSTGYGAGLRHSF